MTDLPQDSPKVIAFTPRGDPVLGPWRCALGERTPVQGVWGAGPGDLLRLLFGRAGNDPSPPAPVPVAPFGIPWSNAHGAWLRRRWPDIGAVVFTRPDQASLLDAFRGTRRVYYAIDDYAAYGRDWLPSERLLLSQADRVVCASRSLAGVLAEREPSAAPKTTVLPNAVPEHWLPPAPPDGPLELPEGLSLPRPLAGVIGRISSRLRLDWILDVVEREPWLHWVFVGDVEREEVTADDKRLIRALRQHPRCTLLGARPFSQLRAFAAAFDVGVLPYSDRSTNPHGSPVRLFIQLPWAAPLLATPGCAQVGDFGPLVTLCDSPAALAGSLGDLRARGFDDRRREERWKAAHEHTWEVRARAWLPLLAPP
jgi:glycosyltransferase involved in cell wall biosynthesis